MTPAQHSEIQDQRGTISAALISSMGDDLAVINAARVSFAKHHDALTDGDTKLIRYLATHGHWTPFAHVTISLRCRAPIFVARQMMKSTVGLVVNEQSRRYIDDEPAFYVPDVWRGRAENSKQGSSDVAVRVSWLTIHEALSACVATYNSLLAAGVCPEQARMVLPQSMMTEWIWTGSLAAFARVCKQRLDPHAQLETQMLARQIADVCAPVAPVSWGVLV